MPRARLSDTEGFYTTSQAARTLGLTPYLIKARIAEEVLPPPTKTTDSGVILFDDEWIEEALGSQRDTTLRKRRRQSRTVVNDIPTPEEILGHTPGEAGWLPHWPEVVHWFETLASHSDRVTVERVGSSTSGLPYIVVAVSAPENLTPEARSHNQDLLGRLWDGRSSDATGRRQAIDSARTIGVILATQHSTEIGATLMTMQYAWDMAMATDRESLDTLRNTVALLIPSHNPDGINMIADWYERVKDTDYLSADLPFLYHPYTGHDNNRDWFMMTQAETRLFVDVHNREHPQAVFDMHQMGRYGARYMVPPFIDPLDPNQDPIIQQGFASLGSHIAQRLTANDKPGVVTHAIFDNYSPSLSYGNYHGSVDLLSEAASAKLATPVTIRKDELVGEFPFDPKRRTWNHPLPWEGGEWSLADIVSYNLISAKAFFHHLAQFRRQWLTDYATLNANRMRTEEKPFGFIIPREQRDPGTAAELLELLQRGLVEVQEATAEVVIDGVTWPAGTRVISLNQPAGDFAKTLLEAQTYPDLRKWKGGPPVPPYDVVGHTLPIQMGVSVLPIEQKIPDGLALETVSDPIHYSGERKGELSAANVWMFDERSNASIAAIQDLLAEDLPVYRSRVSRPEEGIRPGAILVPVTEANDQLLRALVDEGGTDAVVLEQVIDLPVYRQRPVRLGVYRPNVSCMDEGWARWVLEEFGFDYTTLSSTDIRQGNLRDAFDAILIPHMSASAMREGQPKESRPGELNLPEYTTGLGAHGMAELRRFAEQGGTLIAIDAATRAIAEDLALPVSNAVERFKNDEFYCPGSLLRVVVDPHHPLGYGLPRESSVLFMNSVAFDISGREATAVASYPATYPMLSGWILGEKHLSRKGALVDVVYGTGRIVLIGFRPYFRAQTRGTYRVLFNAILRAGFEDEVLSIGAE